VTKPVLQVIVGSTRPGRVGVKVADWFYPAAVAHGAFDVQLVDLAAVALPIFDEPRHPRFGQYEHQHTKDWSATVRRADAFVFVVPEYNYGFNAATKNAIDYLHAEWAYKPVGFVSYGGVAAGTRAVQMLKQVMTTLRMSPIFEAVNIPFVQQFIDGDKFVPNDVLESAASAMLDEVLRWTDALRLLRATA
jgi:NAD(P)H-dependent FMN reductase